VSIAVITLEFLATGEGTELVLTNQGTFIGWPDGAKMVEFGWNTLLDRLRKDVTA
jgi:hypothetical protein